MRRLLLILLGLVIVRAVALLAGPVSSGAVMLLRPGGGTPVDHGLPASYEPRHKGGVDLSTGLYVREDEDLVVRKVPALTLRRTYLSNYRVRRQFGVGTTHDGELYLIGDGVRFQSASLNLAAGTRIEFARISPGASFLNAMYEHRESGSGWLGARLGWTGASWALRRMDGSLSVFQGCSGSSVCSIVKARDADGHTVRYQRDTQGRLARMESGIEWIAFDYDSDNRIRRAYDSTERQVQYAYDTRGRLSRVVGHDGAIRRYTYTAQDQLATINEPGTDIENVYDADGRCIRQINRFPDEKDAAPYVLDFSYRVVHGTVMESVTKRSDGTWLKEAFTNGRVTAETWGRSGAESAVFTYDRDPATNVVTSMTVTCPDRTGRPLRHSAIVRDGNEKQLRRDILQTHCSWRRKP